MNTNLREAGDRGSLAFDSCLFVSIRGLIILLRDLRDEVLKNLSDLYF